MKQLILTLILLAVSGTGYAAPPSPPPPCRAPIPYDATSWNGSTCYAPADAVRDVLVTIGSPICKTITNPNDADAFLFGINQRGATWTINEVRGVALGGTSAVFTLQECDANGANCVQINDAKTITTGTAGTATITNAAIDDNDVLKLDIGTVTGAVTQLMVCAE